MARRHIQITLERFCSVCRNIFPPQLRLPICTGSRAKEVGSPRPHDLPSTRRNSTGSSAGLSRADRLGDVECITAQFEWTRPVVCATQSSRSRMENLDTKTDTTRLIWHHNLNNIPGRAQSSSTDPNQVRPTPIESDCLSKIAPTGRANCHRLGPD